VRVRVRLSSRSAVAESRDRNAEYRRAGAPCLTERNEIWIRRRRVRVICSRFYFRRGSCPLTHCTENSTSTRNIFLIGCVVVNGRTDGTGTAVVIREWWWCYKSIVYTATLYRTTTRRRNFSAVQQRRPIKNIDSAVWIINIRFDAGTLLLPPPRALCSRMISKTPPNPAQRLSLLYYIIDV